MIDKLNFAIRVAIEDYKEPIGIGKKIEVAKRSSTDYFICGDLIYAPIDIKASSSVSGVVHDVGALKKMFFDANEIAKYIRP
jgi:hypothetical protein